jgi:hypothetical protein
MNKFRAFIGMFFLAVSIGQSEEVIRIGIGTQDTTINCAAGGAVERTPTWVSRPIWPERRR